MKVLLSLISIHFLVLGSSASADRVVFIGEPLGVIETDVSCMDLVEGDGICLDRVFELTYKVRQTLHGDSADQQLEFYGMYHYHGLPWYTGWPEALVVTHTVNEQLVLHSIFPVEEHHDRLGVCISRYEDETEECSEFLSLKDAAERLSEDA